MSIGFKGFARPATLKADEVSGGIENIAADEFVFWTGENYRARRGSGRYAVLSTVKESGKFVPVRELAKRAAKAAGDKGFRPSFVSGGLYNHQGSKPTVFFYLVRDEEGNYRAKRDIPFPSEKVSSKAIKAGEIVFSKAGKAIAVSK